MILSLASIALGQQVQLLPTDALARRWIVETRALTHTVLPVVGPTSASVLVRTMDRERIQFIYAQPSDNSDDLALIARLELGSPCALVLAPTEEGWAGWRSGDCGRIGIGAWRWEGNRVFDWRGRPVTVPQFAAITHDTEVQQTYRRLSRRRGRAIGIALLGSGLLYAGLIQGLDGRQRPLEPIFVGAGSAITAVGLFEFLWVQGKKTSHPRQLDAHYTEEELREAVLRRNERLKISIRPTPTGVIGAF